MEKAILSSSVVNSTHTKQVCNKYKQRVGFIYSLLLLLLLYSNTNLAATIRHSGEIDQDTTWDATDTHLIEGDITVPADVTLKITAGAELKFNDTTRLRVNGGNLVVEGTAVNPVIFTSTATGETHGAWRGIRIVGGNARIEQAQISNFSGRGVSFEEGATGLVKGSLIDNLNSNGSCVYLKNASPTLQGNTLTRCDIGIYLYGASNPLVNDGNTIAQNRYGIYSQPGRNGSAWVGPQPEVNRNRITDNTDYHYYNKEYDYNYYEYYWDDAPDYDQINLNARENWWGTTDIGAIQAKIRDGNESTDLPYVDISAYLDAADGQPITETGIITGRVASDTTLTKDAPYTVMGSLEVPADKTLKIEAGAQLNFVNGARLHINGGNLVVQGTAANPVLFTSTAIEERHGAWRGIQVVAGNARIEQAQINDFSGRGVSFEEGATGLVKESLIDNLNGAASCVSLKNASPTLQGNTLTRCNKGIYLEGASNPLVNGGNIITQNRYGLYSDPLRIDNTWVGPQPVVNRNQITDNSDYNYYNEYDWRNIPGHDQPFLDARENWWGTTDIGTIQAKIYDGNDSTDMPYVDISAYLEGADGQPVTLAAGTIMGRFAGDTTLIKDAPYTLMGSLEIPANTTLTIEAGARLNFSDGARLRVNGGNLVVQGTAANPVIFTSTATGETHGNWQGIQIVAGNARIEQARISNFSYQGAGVSFEAGATGLVKDSLIDNLNRNGSCVMLKNASPTLQGNTLTRCARGIYLKGASNPLINGGNIITQNRYGLYSQPLSNDSAWVGPQPVVNRNQITGSTSQHYYNSNNWQYVPGHDQLNLDARENWWGTTDIGAIQAKIYDRNDLIDLPYVDFRDYLDVADGQPVAVAGIIMGRIAGDTTLTRDAPYTVVGSLEVPADATLRIEAGAQLNFVDGAQLQVNGGNLVVQGTPADPVIFTSIATGETHGTWRGIQVVGGSARIEQARISNFSGQGISFEDDATGLVKDSLIDNLNRTASCVMLRNASPTLQGNTLTRCEKGIDLQGASNPLINGGNSITHNRYGFYSDPLRIDNTWVGPQPVVNRNQITGNTSYHYINHYNWQYVPGQDQFNLDARENWWGTTDIGTIQAKIHDRNDRTNLPYVDFRDYLDAADGQPVAAAGIIVGRIAIDTTLTKEAPYTLVGSLEVPTDATLRIEAGAQLNFVDGAQLLVNGGNLVVDGTAENPVIFTNIATGEAHGTWRGIRVVGGNATIEQARISNFSGQGVSFEEDATGLIKNSHIDNLNSTAYCVRLKNASPTLQGNTLTRCDRGIYLHGASNPLVNGGNIITQNRYGLYTQPLHNGSEYVGPQPVVNRNQITDNTSYHYYNDYWRNVPGYEQLILDARENWWGTTNIGAIQAKIRDRNDSTDRPYVDIRAYLDAADGQPVADTFMGRITGDTTLTKDAPYTLVGNLEVPADTTLTIEAGAQLKFGDGTRLHINGGNLVVEGTAENPVIFTSTATGETHGAWEGIQVVAGNALIEQARISNFSGQGVTFEAGATGLVKDSLIDNLNSTAYCVRLKNAGPTLQGNTLTRCERGIYLEGASNPLITGGNIITHNRYGLYSYPEYNGNKYVGPRPVVNRNQITDNTGYHYYHYYSYNRYASNRDQVYLDARENWWGTTDIGTIQAKIYDRNDRTGLPYVDIGTYLDAADGQPVVGAIMGLIAGDTTLSKDAPYTLVGSLEVPSGTTLRIEAGSQLNFVNGAQLHVNGGNLVVEGTAANPVIFASTATDETHGAWRGIRVVSGNATIKNARISNFSGQGVSFEEGATGLVKDSLIDNLNSTAYCVTLKNASPSLQGNTLTRCDRGIYLEGASNPLVNGSNIITRNRYGIYSRPFNNGYEYVGPQPVVNRNQLTDNTSHHYYNHYNWQYVPGQDQFNLDARENWWGTTDIGTIQAKIHDRNDNTDLPYVDFIDYLDAADGQPVAVAGITMGRIDSDTTLTKDAPYTLVGNLEVAADATLRIEAGAQLNFVDGAQLQVNGGNLVVEGTAENPVIFTSTATGETHGNWQGIQIVGGNARIEQARISNFSGQGISYEAGATGLVKESLIDNLNSSGHCVFLKDASPTLQGNTLTRCDRGIYLQGASNPQVNGGNIIAKNRYGIYSYPQRRSRTWVGPQPAVNHNQIIDNTSHHYYNHTYWRNVPGHDQLNLNARENWWGTTDINAIQAKIYDRNDFTKLPYVDIRAYLDAADGQPVAVTGAIMGRIASDTTLTKDAPYTLMGSLEVPADTTLRIEAGAQLNFVDGARLHVNGGNLVVQGTAANPVIFTSTATGETHGAWQGIQVVAGNAMIEQAQISNFSGQGVSFEEGATGLVKDSLIDNLDGTAYCVTLKNTSPTLQGNTLTRCDRGIYLHGGSNPQVNGGNIITQNRYGLYTQPLHNGSEYVGPQPVVNRNQITDNTSHHYYNHYYWRNVPGHDLLTLDARENWWGTADIGAIQAKIYDRNDRTDLPLVDITDYLQSKIGGSDTTPPEVTSTSSAAEIRTGRITVQAVDPSGIDRVEFLLDGTPVPAQTGANGYSAIVNYAQLTEGAHDIAYAVYDGHQNSASGSINLNIDFQPPAVPAISSPVAGSRVGTNQMTVAGTADARSRALIHVDSDQATEPIFIGSAGTETTVQLYLNGAPISAPAAVNSNGRYQQAATLEPGENSITVKAITRGGTSAMSPAVTVSLDQDGPVISNMTYLGSAFTDNFELTQSGALSVQATDPSGVSRVDFKVDALPVNTDANGGDGYSLPLTIAFLAEGVHAITISAYDSFDNVTTRTIPFTVAAEPPPAPVITAPKSGLVTNQPQITVAGTAEPKSTVSFFVNGASAGQAVTATEGGQFQGSVTLVEGTNSITAKASNRGGESAPSSAVAVTLDSTIPEAPVLTVTQSEGGEITLRWNAVQAEPKIAGYRLYRANSTFATAASAAQLNTGLITNATYTDLPAEDGEYYYRVQAENELGTQSALSNEVSATVDSTAPRALSIQYTPTGRFDSASGRMAPGEVQVVVQVNEPLLTAPFLGISPHEGIPIPVSLNKTGDTEYKGSFEIKESTPTGTAYAVFSARDLFGNRGTGIDEGRAFEIDTDGPAVGNITVTPAHPIRNDTADPVTVNVQIELDEAVQSGTQPALAYKLSGAGRSDSPVDNLTSIEPQKWTGSFVLPADAGQAAPELLQFSFSAQDDLDNLSTKIKAKNSFQVYQGDLPPLAFPGNLQARALPGGEVRLSWDEVAEASDYQLFRQAPGEAELQPLKRSGGALEHTDQTDVDGLHRYAVASVRSGNGQESTSAPGPVVEVTADATPPSAPQNLQLELGGAGILATWQDPDAEENVTYALYRAGDTEIPDVEGLTPVLKRIKGLAIIDPSPSQEEHAYAVTAVDVVGNESAPSETAYLNFGLLPVNRFTVTRDGDQLPVLNWSHTSPAAIAGYNLYLERAGSRSSLNDNLLTGTQFTDTGYSDEERLYAIITVDRNDVQSIERKLLLPRITAVLDEDTQLKRGIMNRLRYTVANEGKSAVDNIRLHARMGAHANRSQKFSLNPGERKTAEVILGGYRDLEGLSALESTISIRPNPGEEAKIIQRQDLLIGDAGLVLKLATRELTRGATGQVQISLDNTSEVEIELESANRNGNQPSGDIRFKLIDADGNVLSTQSFKQYVGEHIVALANGKTVARIAPGETFTSEWFTLQVPSAAPDETELLLEVDRLHYHLTRDDAESIGVNLQARALVLLIETDYYGELTEITPASSYGDQPIQITGKAVNRDAQQPEFTVPLKLIIAANGFERVKAVQTDAQGNFSYSFSPLPGESGVYTVSIIHPDILERPQQGAFTLSRLIVSPTRAKLNIPRNLDHPGRFRVSAGQGTRATNVRLEYNAEEQPAGALPAGIRVTLPPPIDMTSAQSRDLVVKVRGDEDAPDEGRFVLTLKSAETGAKVMGSITVDYRFSAAQPVLGYRPNHLQTGVVYDGTVSETLSLENKGLTALENASLQLLTQGGTPAPVWLSLVSAAHLGDLAVGQKQQVQISAAPNSTVAEGMHQFKLRVSSDNFTTTDIPITVAVTQSGIGHALIKVSDIYTATLDDNGEVIQGLAGARIKLINDKVITLEKSLRTDPAGEALFKDLTAGTYRYRISAEDHQDKTGQIRIKPGITASEEIFLDSQLIRVEWSVNEITIQDLYEITLQATFKTDVPAAVVVAKPASVTLPDLQKGDIFYGEFTLTNHGLIRADNLKINLPADDQFFRYELIGGLPDSMEAKEVITVPYRALMLQSFEPDGTGSGGGCYHYVACGKTNYSYDCANGTTSGGSTRHCLTRSGGSCGGSGGGSSGGGGGGGWGGWGGWGGGYGGGGTTDTDPGLMVCRPDNPTKPCPGNCGAQ